MRAVRIFRWVQYSNVTDRCSRQSERPIFPNVCLNLGTYFLMSASERDGTGDNSAENSTLHEFFSRRFNCSPRRIQQGIARTAQTKTRVFPSLILVRFYIQIGRVLGEGGVNELTVFASLTVRFSSEGFVKCCALRNA